MSVPENPKDFNSIERFIYDTVCRQGREQLKEILECYDKELQESRDKSVYRYKEKRPTTLKTIMGEVEYRRVMYEVRYEDGSLNYVYLLDEAIGLTCSGQMSGVLSEVIAQAACESSYRSAARQVSEMTGQRISHTGAWNVVQDLGARLDAEELAAASAAAQNEGAGTHETKVLFEEQDGIWLPLQGKSRKEHGESKEMKLAIAYDGAKKRGKKRYELTNKVACASFESAEKFVKRKEGVIAGHYNIDEIVVRILGGDGAGWIRRSQTDESVHFQLDSFHRNKSIRQYVSDPEIRKDLFELLYAKDIELLLHVLEVHALSTDDEEERDHYNKLLSYFQNNKDGLIPYKRRGLDLPELPEGVDLPRLGSMESNIFTILGDRMKRGRMSWSTRGGGNLARLLCLKHTGKLIEVLRGLASLVLPERYAEEVAVKMSAAKAPQRDGKGYDGFNQMSIPSSMKWLKELASLRTVV